MILTRLDRFVSERSPLSRSAARRAIQRGRVQVDGERVRSPAAHVTGHESVTLDGRALLPPLPFAAFHKAAGVQSTVGDPVGRPNLAEAAVDLLIAGLHPVGRLDADTTGLLLFSSSGQATQAILHPRRGIAKRYVARVEGTPGAALVEALTAGVATAHGVHIATVHDLQGDQVTLSVTEGKHRMVRRMLANAGHPVVSLKRTHVGEVALGDLPAGEWRSLTAEELTWMASLTPTPDT